MDDPKIDPERMKQWKANILPVPSAELLKGKGSGAAPCSALVQAARNEAQEFRDQVQDCKWPKHRFTWENGGTE